MIRFQCRTRADIIYSDRVLQSLRCLCGEVRSAGRLLCCFSLIASANGSVIRAWIGSDGINSDEMASLSPLNTKRSHCSFLLQPFCPSSSFCPLFIQQMIPSSLIILSLFPLTVPSVTSASASHLDLNIIDTILLL